MKHWKSQQPEYRRAHLDRRMAEGEIKRTIGCRDCGSTFYYEDAGENMTVANFSWICKDCADGWTGEDNQLIRDTALNVLHVFSDWDAEP